MGKGERKFWGSLNWTIIWEYTRGFVFGYGEIVFIRSYQEKEEEMKGFYFIFKEAEDKSVKGLTWHLAYTKNCQWTSGKERVANGKK